MIKYIYCLGEYVFDEKLYSLTSEFSFDVSNLASLDRLEDEEEILEAVKKLNEFPGLFTDGNFLHIESRETYFQDNINEWEDFRKEVDMSLFVTNYIPEATPILNDYDTLVTQLTAELGVLKNKYGSYVVVNNMLLGFNDFLLTYATNGKKYEVKNVFEFEY